MDTNQDAPNTEIQQSPEVNLWVTVVMQAINDLSMHWRSAYSATRTYSRRCLLDAHGWLFSPQEEADFMMVCHFAQLDHEWVRRMAVERMQQEERGWRPERLHEICSKHRHFLVVQPLRAP